ncbi:hypothetical protein [Butyrivibrio sp. AC2005]|uniref:hypothetical protein n=1 Tax=Butyrivibrio sp. AC2005 TaxID=1280672 RepID=UPI000412D7C5|nr:hypothetical protein [Butyrivibrio sp. AC2005]
MNNKRIRRAIRKYIQKSGKQGKSTRRIAAIFSKAYNTTEARIYGNIRSMKYDQKTNKITTIIPGSYSIIS